ncbi:DUF4817 domain-containing protein [Trichonephila clavipes]|nr:DUF4817 domain-containing protein [Trichonephila clavipes]
MKFRTETILFAGMCARNFTKTESAITVQGAFRIKFGCQPPNDNIFRCSIISLKQLAVFVKGKLGHKEPPDKPCIAWPPRLPDLTPCVFYLWRFIKDCMYVPPLPADLSDLRYRMEADVARISSDTLKKVWDQLTYRLNQCRVTNGAHIEHL